MASTLKVNTIESASGTNIAVPTGKTLTAADAAAIRAPGMVIQTVFDAYDTQTSTNSSTFTDVGIEATITPKSASNKILCHVHVNGVYKDGSNISGIGIKFLRTPSGGSATEVARLANRAAGDNGSGSAAVQSIGTVSGCILDSPNTTSAVTYKCQFNAASNAGTAYVQVYTVESTLVLQEIAQ
tara:strand:- start:52 stop:603 length:552 start_codon:yes stop_codon:yes gene_type:complete